MYSQEASISHEYRRKKGRERSSEKRGETLERAESMEFMPGASDSSWRAAAEAM